MRSLDVVKRVIATRSEESFQLEASRHWKVILKISPLDRVWPVSRPAARVLDSAIMALRDPLAERLVLVKFSDKVPVPIFSQEGVSA